jgi:hypothetical protein
MAKPKLMRDRVKRTFCEQYQKLCEGMKRFCGGRNQLVDF